MGKLVKNGSVRIKKKTAANQEEFLGLNPEPGAWFNSRRRKKQAGVWNSSVQTTRKLRRVQLRGWK